MALNKSSLNALEKHLASQVHKTGLKNSRLLLAISGGKDSMTLLHSMNQIATDFGMDLQVAHFHHGHTDETAIVHNFRDQALDIVRRKCSSYKNPFYFEIHQGKKLHSEDLLRKSRWSFLKQISKKAQCKAIVTAHHKNDLLETRLLRLIRGVGLQGMESMTTLDGHIFRPLLNVLQKDVIEAYTTPIEYIEDPSNASDHTLRNWMRTQWLPDLEKRSSGAIKALARSLDLLSQKHDEIQTEAFWDKQGIHRTALEGLSKEHQHQVIASYLRQHNFTNYTASHIFEIQKRLQSSQKTFDFCLLKHKWVVSPTHIKAYKKD